MTEILHAWAIAPAAIGTCCLAADRGRVRWPELAASVLMILAMVDAALSHALPAVGWMVVLIGSAIGLAALRRVRPLHARAAGGAARNVRGLGAMTVHTTLGMIAMAALQLAMSGTGAPAAASASHAHGGGSGAGLAAVLLASAVAYIVASLVLAVRAHGRLDRAQYAAMGVSVLAMGLAIVV